MVRRAWRRGVAGGKARPTVRRPSITPCPGRVPPRGRAVRPPVVAGRHACPAAALGHLGCARRRGTTEHEAGKGGARKRGGPCGLCVAPERRAPLSGVIWPEPGVMHRAARPPGDRLSRIRCRGKGTAGGCCCRGGGTSRAGSPGTPRDGMRPVRGGGSVHVGISFARERRHEGCGGDARRHFRPCGRERQASGARPKGAA